MAETVLVTGGSGFVGTWVLRSLQARGLKAVALDAVDQRERWTRILGEKSASQIPFVAGSLLDRSLLARIFEEHQVTRVIHLAALLTPACQQDPYLGCEVNVLGSVALFEQAVKSGLSGLSYASSLAIFGPEPDSTLAATGAENRPPSFYGAFKKSLELIAEQYWLHRKLATVGIRPHIIYGPERAQGLTAAPSLAAKAAAFGQSSEINYQGIAGYDYVDDVAEAFVRTALETPPGAVVVDLPSEPATIPELVQAIDAIVPGSAGRIKISGPVLPRNDSPRDRLIGDLLLDWKATSIADGMRRTIEFYRQSPTT